MFDVYISVVSHGNEEEIICNSNLLLINKMDNVFVLVRDNLSNTHLKLFCHENDYFYSASEKKMGFGENNNVNFKNAMVLGMKPNDRFILINPDVDITPEMVLKLIHSFDITNKNIYAINLFKDEQLIDMESSLRFFPNIFSFFNIFRGQSFTKPYDKLSIFDKDKVDWAAGSFLVFKAEVFDALKGFDERYFMYFEDVDICYRAMVQLNVSVIYLKNIKAHHKGGYKNRSILSLHFKWYLTSLFRFLFKSSFLKLINKISNSIG